MTGTQQHITESLITDLQNGTLTEARLRQKIAAIATETEKNARIFFIFRLEQHPPHRKWSA